LLSCLFVFQVVRMLKKTIARLLRFKELLWKLDYQVNQLSGNFSAVLGELNEQRNWLNELARQENATAANTAKVQGELQAQRNSLNDLASREGATAANTANVLAALKQQQDLLNELMNRVNAPVVAVEPPVVPPLRERETESERLTAVADYRQRCLSENETALAALIEQERQRAVTLPTQWPGPAPLFSVIMPTWNRGEVIEHALRSVQTQSWPHWECWIVDDGSTDDTAARVKPFLQDERFHYLAVTHRGAAAARNVGVERAQGQLIAYLDTDNLWLPHHLTNLAEAFLKQPELMVAYDLQIVKEVTGGQWLRGRSFEYQQLLVGNYIDGNMLAHRKELVARYGGFDETLPSLQDWDLLRRYTAHEPTQLIPTLGGIYQHGLPNQITLNQSSAYGRFLIEQKDRATVKRAPLRVLYAVWHYPQLSESYIRSEINAVRRLGVEVEVWSENDVAAGFESDVHIHRGAMSQALADFKPELVQVHWLNIAGSYVPEVQAAGLPMTVRGHGFEVTPEMITSLLEQETIKRVYLFPHFAKLVEPTHSKVKAVPALFDTRLYQPQFDKDRKMVLRVGCALPTKDYATFFEVARRCPSHRFVLIICRGYRIEEYADELLRMRERMSSPVEIHLNWQHEDVAALMKKSGIYLHTFGGMQPYGMPISLSEAMASGCYVIARNAPGAADYVGAGGALYHTVEQATALVQATQDWDEQAWREAYRAASQQAYSKHADVSVVESVVDDWHAIVKARK
jgi:glycosyltransferase involved in cell wall biosynthesis